MKVDITVTLSKILAFLIVTFGFLLSWRLSDSSPFMAACTAGGAILSIKVGISEYNKRKPATNIEVDIEPQG